MPDQTTNIGVTGCPKAKAAKKRSKGKRVKTFHLWPAKIAVQT